jgi:hypothetical protein
MAELHHGRVMRIELGGAGSDAKERLLDHMLSEMDGITAHHIDPVSRTLTAYVDHTLADEDDIIRALIASGMFPVKTREVGHHEEDDTRVC